MTHRLIDSHSMQVDKPRAASMPKWARAAPVKPKGAAPQVPGKQAKAGSPASAKLRKLSGDLAFVADPAKPVVQPVGEVRIVGGLYKRTKLAVPSKPGLRPTPDRVRETLFNWLGQDLTGWHCLDAFAGTGALGFECASRGATRVLMAELDGDLVGAIQKTKGKLKADAVELHKGEGIAFMGRSLATQDLVLIDPPFDSGLYDKALAAAASACKTGGYVYLEAPERFLEARLAPFGLAPLRYLKAGNVHAHLLQKN